MPSQAASRPSGNLFLDRLPDDEFDLLAPMLKRVSLTPKQVVHPFDVDVTHAHFPTTALLSLLATLSEDGPVEVGTVGKEGFVGVSASLGVAASPHRVICQMGGESLTLPARALLGAMGEAPGLTRLVRRYTAFTLRDCGQTIACDAMHLVESRACRSLLVLHDQAGRDEFPMTHEFLAYMLGVRRQSVTVVAGALQHAGMISYRRGVVVIRDRAGLEEAACECYAMVRDYYRRVVN